jgi:hypothetical protein
LPIFTLVICEFDALKLTVNWPLEIVHVEPFTVRVIAAAAGALAQPASNKTSTIAGAQQRTAGAHLPETISHLFPEVPMNSKAGECPAW